MSLVRYQNGFDRSLGSLLNGILNDTFHNNTVGNSVSTEQFYPKVDIAETDTAFEIQLLVPGVDKADFDIKVDQGKLVISGERNFEAAKEGKKFRAVETQYGKFSRAFKLSEIVDQGAISAKYEAGLLKVTLPKDEKKTVKTSIEVK